MSIHKWIHAFASYPYDGNEEDLFFERSMKKKILNTCFSYAFMQLKFVLPPFQIIRRFGFSSYIAFNMHLDIYYV
jgi:hypothetical protein